LGHFRNPSASGPAPALTDDRRIEKEITRRGDDMQGIVYGISWDDPKRLAPDPTPERRGASS
jgi:hypothetical protein